MNDTEFDLIGRTDLAAKLGISERTLDTWTREGILPQPWRIKGRSYFKVAEVEAALLKGQVK